MHKTTKSYTLAGILFGLMFPIIGTCVQLFNLDRGIGINEIFQIHVNTPLLLIIDLAPFILGFLGYFIGHKQMKLVILSESLQNANRYQSTDISELNEKLKQKAVDLQQLSYVANHDLKSTLRGIASLTNFIQEESDQKEKEKLEQLLEKRIVRMDKLLDAILDFLKLTNEKNEIEKLSLSEMMSSLIANCDREVLYDAGNFKSPIFIDRNKAQAILRELIDNSIKFTAKNQILEIKTAIHNLGPYTHITFEDNGPGIETKYNQKVFEPFTTLDFRDDTENIGMGLAIVKRLIKDMGGEIELCPAKGTKYEIKLPNND